MKHLYRGKTKDVFLLEDGNYLLKFKDDMTGEEGVFDPGSNTVGLSVPGAGRAGLGMSAYYFKLLNDLGIRTHFLSADLEAATMTVLPVSIYGKGLEVICRFRAFGSFIRRYGAYTDSGAMLSEYVEMTLKDDERGDPLITRDALDALGIMSLAEHDRLQTITREISRAIKSDLQKRGMELYDIKLEFGRIGDEIILIDEISGGNMRVFCDGIAIDPLELSKRILV